MIPTTERKPTTILSTPPLPLLVNDKAGELHATAGAAEFQSIAQRLDLAIEILPTKSAEDMVHQLQRLRASGAPRVAVAGGDGTVACAAQTLAGSDTVLGIVAQGTANNFATALRLPADLPGAMRVLKEGDVSSVDLGRIGDRYFTESAGVGLFADALSLYDGVHKSIWRTLWTYGKILISARARRMRLIVDGEPHAERAVWCEVANSFRIGYGVAVAPEAKLTDGLLDVVVLGDLRLKEMWTVFNAIRTQSHHSLPQVTMTRAREVRIESHHRMNVHSDDAIIGTVPVTISVAPGALKVLVDRL